MQRREFLKTLAVGTAGAVVLEDRATMAAPGPAKPVNRFLLSETGASQATGWGNANKIITLGGKTHVTWLDSVREGFRVRIRTLDRSAGQWSPTYTLGEAFDNHGCPALTVDSRGFLHVVYYPHHNPFRYRRSVRPNDASQWEEEVRFGQRCTHPMLMCGADDTLYLVCRESLTDLWRLNLYTKSPGGRWQGPVGLVRVDKPGYAHFQAALCWGPDRRTLHLSCHIKEGNWPHTVGYLCSPDAGKTWQRHDGTRPSLPATADTVTVIAKGSKNPKVGFRCGSVAVDQRGAPYVTYSYYANLYPETWIASPDASGKWHSRSLVERSAGLPAGMGLAMSGALTFGSDGRMFLGLTMRKPPPRDPLWGHPTTEIAWLESKDDGESFTVRTASEPAPHCPNWAPSLERATGHNRIEVPSLIYTSGLKYLNPLPENLCDAITANKVYWVEME